MLCVDTCTHQHPFSTPTNLGAAGKLAWSSLQIRPLAYDIRIPKSDDEQMSKSHISSFGGLVLVCIEFTCNEFEPHRHRAPFFVLSKVATVLALQHFFHIFISIFAHLTFSFPSPPSFQARHPCTVFPLGTLSSSAASRGCLLPRGKHPFRYPSCVFGAAETQGAER